MSEFFSFKATDPESKKVFTKKISIDTYGREKAKKMGDDWVKSVNKGLYSPSLRTNKSILQDTFIRKKSLKDESSDDDGSVIDIFEKKPINELLLELPDDKFGVSFLLLGATRSGKSTLMNWIYDTFFKSYITILHTGSHQSEIYKPLQKSCCIAPLFASELISETSKINSNTNNHYKFLHIIDDIVDKKNSRELIKLLTIGRNHRLNTIITGQELSVFNAIGRSNINYVILLRLNSDMAIEKVIKTYLRSYFPTGTKLNDMIQTYKELTAEHGFFFIDNLNDKIFASKLVLN
jgi:Poxvirus A32 protein